MSSGVGCSLWHHQYLQHLYNIFTTILGGRLLLVIISEQESNFSVKFRLKGVTTFHLRFIVKIL